GSSQPAGVLVAGSIHAGQVTFRLTNVGAREPEGLAGNVIVTRQRGVAFGSVGVTALPSPSKNRTFGVPNVMSYCEDVGFVLGVVRRSATTLDSSDAAAVCEIELWFV